MGEITITRESSAGSVKYVVRRGDVRLGSARTRGQAESIAATHAAIADSAARLSADAAAREGK